MKLTVKAGGVPPGSYIAKFLGVEPKESQFGPGLMWTFEVVNGPQASCKATAMTQTTPTPGNGCGRLLAGVLGKMPSVGESVELSPCVGKHYLIIVKDTKTGKGTKVESVTAPPTA